MMAGKLCIRQQFPGDPSGKAGDPGRICLRNFSLSPFPPNSARDFADEHKRREIPDSDGARKGQHMSDSDSKRTPHFLLTTEGELHGQDTEENREIVRRIHACVNACDGISTEELEKGIITDMRRVLAQVVPVLERQNRKSA
jgi:hypothetical protein